MNNAKVVKNILSDRSVAWNVEYDEGHLHLTIGCTDKPAAERLAKCLNEAAWVQADVGETT